MTRSDDADGPRDALTRRGTAVLFLCFFLSGAGSLVYEVVWLRWLTLVFGATTLAISTTLAAFMGGLAAGSWAGGRLATRVRRPVVAYGVLESGSGPTRSCSPCSSGRSPRR